MSTPARAKGTKAETALVGFLRENGWPHAERRALAGNADKGDVTGTPGVVWESKAGSVLKIPAWMAETEVERINADADYGVLVIKPVGLGALNVGRWWAVQPLEAAVRLLRTASYGAPLPERLAGLT